MARIPTRAGTRELPSGPSQLPSVRMSAAPTADQLGANARVSNQGARRDVTSALEHFSNATLLIEKRKDNTAVMTALAEAQRAAAMQQNEIANRKGAFAEGATQDTGKFFDEQYEVLAGRLRNNRQREAFNEKWTQLRVNSEVFASKHESTEGRRALVESSQATISGAIELAAAVPDDPVAQADYRDQILIATQNAMAAQGHKAGSNVTALEQLKNLSAMHETVLGAMVKTDPTAAEEYLGRFKAEMNATTLDRATKLVETQSRLKKAQSFADEAVGRGMDEIEAIAEARKRFSGEDEKDAVLEVKTRFVERNAARERMQRQAADDAWKTVEQTGSLANVDPMTLNAMDGKDVAAIRRHLEQQLESKARRLAADENRAWTKESRAYTREQRQFTREQRENTRANQAYTVQQRERAEQNRLAGEAYDAARKMMFTDPEGFKNTDWRRSNDVLTYDQIQSLRKMQEKPVVKDFLTYEQQLTRATATMDKEDKVEFQMAVDKAVQLEQERQGKELPQKERQELITRMETEYKIERNWMPDKSVKGYQITPENRDRAYLPDMPDLPRPAVEAVISGGVPKDAIQRLIDHAKSKGITDPSPELLIKQYQFETRKK